MKVNINPTVQQGGAWTIQQSIYLTHDNPCGENMLLYKELASTDITYHTLIQMLNDAIEQPEIIELFKNIQNASFLYDQYPTEQHRLQVTYLIYIYSLALWQYLHQKYAHNEIVKGYEPSFSSYEASGNMIFDSSTEMNTPGLPQYWMPVYEVSPGVYDYTPVELVTPNNFNVSSCNLYGIVGKPAYFPYIKATAVTPFGDQAKILNSGFLTNQMSYGESVMAIGSIIVDPANTRVYGESLFGLSTRTSEHGNFSYNVCYIQTLRGLTPESTYRFFNNISNNFFIRFSLTRMPVDFFH